MNEETRREFLQKSALLGAAAAVPNSLPAAEAAGLPPIPFGAVYFRKSAPPERDWERDYRQAAKDGMNAFRHWFIWSAIEVAPGRYDWADYDRQMDLAAKHGIKTIIGEISSGAPLWAFRKWPHARMRSVDGSTVGPHYSVAAAVGGWPGLCLDNDEVLARSEEFVRQLARRYRDHPGLGGYDVWNELNHLADAGGCWCEASADKFRAWLKEKYDDLKTLAEAWHCYSFADWRDVRIPDRIGPYPNSIDFGLFRIDNAMRIFERRVKLIRDIDPDHPIINHTIPMGALDRVFPDTYPKGGSYPVFRATRLVDITGFSGGGNHDDRYHLRWSHWAKLDITRSAAGDKPFWCAEMTVGNSWRMKNMDVDKGRITNAQDVRLCMLTNLAGGVRGFFSPRWRPLQDGPTFGSFAWYAMDGSPTERSEAGREMAVWMAKPAHKSLLAARPVRSDLGILLVPDSLIHTWCTQEDIRHYYGSVTGAYQAFLFNQLQPDFVPADDIPAHIRVLYLPFPAMLPDKVVQTLIAWVRRGGSLISEGCPGYFGDLGTAGTVQPNRGLAELFGVEQRFVQFTPDLLEKLEVRLTNGGIVDGGVYRQAYRPTTGKAFARYDDGLVAGVENRFGKGRTRLLGTFPGFRHKQRASARTRNYFADAFAWTGQSPHLTGNNPNLVARLQRNAEDGRLYLWVVNSSRKAAGATYTIAQRHGEVNAITRLRGKTARLPGPNKLDVTVPAREVEIIELHRNI